MFQTTSPILNSEQTNCEFQMDVHIRKKRPRPLFEAFGKSIYDVEWINGNTSRIILLKIAGARATREAGYYVSLSCHSNIVHTFGLVQCHPDSVMLLQERAPLGDLSERLQEGNFRPTEGVLCKLFEQISDALIFLADNGVTHGDLACRNVLVFQSDPTDPSKNLVKLTDFGLTRASSIYSAVATSARTTMTIIPIRYAAPEILRDTTKLNYSEQSDVYSMGVLMWEACSNGDVPYGHLDNENEVIRQKLNDKRLPRPSICGDTLWNIMNECWEQNPRHRMNFRTLNQFVRSLSLDLERQRNLSRRIPCEYCHKQFTPEDHPSHQQTCPSNQTKNPPKSLKSNENTSTLSVHCNQLISSSDRLTHMRTCRSQKNEQILLINSRSKDSIPCEFCYELYSTNRITNHQINCLRNPASMNSTIDEDETPLLPKNERSTQRNLRFPCRCC